MRDAIALNASRAPRYAAQSNGASLAISRRLILSERALLPVARWFDRWAAPYERAGIPLLEGLFVSMEGAPPLLPVGRPVEPAPVPIPRAAGVRARVLTAYRAHGFDGAADALADEIVKLADARGTDCLVRHLLESAHRLAALAPEQIRRAEAQGLATPSRMLSLLFRLHLLGLGSAAALDARARPLQARGIAILAQDLPPIPPPER